jgi:FGGY-family pentulose kinase
MTPRTSNSPILLAVDVGSTSARAGAFDCEGRMLASASWPFDVGRPAADHCEHDALQIWQAVGIAVRAALAEAEIAPQAIAGLAFDATCSLVMLDGDGSPVTASTTGDDRWNVVMWADHRATAEAAEINATGHKVLDYVGGTMSPEMELPKLLWLKRHLPRSWARYGMALDLADYLTWRATGAHAVSACTVTCKWGYLNHEHGWPVDLLARVGLDDLLARMRLPPAATPLGACIGRLTPAAAADLGLAPGIPVGTGLIDAHAGGLGVLAGAGSFDEALAVIGGTSTCHMAVSAVPRAVPGVWGPYFGAMLPGLWLNEGGQSATGALLDHVLDLHAEGRGLAGDRHGTVVEHIQRRKAEEPGYARDLLVLPDFHGNRSPLADPALRGVIHGLDLDRSFEGVARLYHAAAVGIVYGTRHILDALDARGYGLERLHLTGGHARNPLLVQLYADATGRTVVLPREPDGVLLGTALAAAAAAGVHADLFAAGRAMVHDGRRVMPDPAAAARHERGYAAFRRMIEHRREVMSLLGLDKPLG